jgi:hypothetical protein
VEDVEQEMAQMLTKKSEDKEEDGNILTGDDEKEPSEDASVTKEEGWFGLFGYTCYSVSFIEGSTCT